ncbi:MAG: hypothetical protein WD078_03760 [Woeseia sp.]
MTFTIEPIVNAGKRAVRQLLDGWTAVTAEQSLSAPFDGKGMIFGGFDVIVDE